MIITVGTTPVKLCDFDRHRKKLKIQNQDDATTLFYRKDDPNVSSSGAHKGKEILPNQNYINDDPDCRFEVWAYASSSIEVDVEEEF